MPKRKIGQFQTRDDGGTHYTVVEYRSFEQSNEIRPDRMSPDPIAVQIFETLKGGAVEQVSEDTFQILGVNKLVRKI